MNPARFAAIVLCASALMLVSCATDDQAGAGDRSMADRPAASPMRGIMHAKLVHTQAIVEGIATSDFDAVAQNADDLVELSERGSWMVHDTMAYVAFSDDFRNTARTLADDARRGDADRVVEHYSDLIRTCVACHDYLRRERLLKDLPGKVSRADFDQLLVAMRARP